MSNVATDQDVVQAVLDAENNRIAASNRGDWDAVDQLLGEDLTYTHMNGRMENKAENMENTKGSPRTYERRDLSVRVFGDVAVMNGLIDVEIHALPDGTPARNLHGRVVQVWALRDDRWQMVVFQATAVPDAA